MVLGFACVCVCVCVYAYIKRRKCECVSERLLREKFALLWLESYDSVIHDSASTAKLIHSCVSE